LRNRTQRARSTKNHALTHAHPPPGDKPSMSTPTDPLTGTQLDQVADFLDACRNMNGGLPADIRARIFAAIDTPSDSTWLQARSVIIAEKGTTLWQAAITAGVYPEATPHRRDIIRAIADATVSIRRNETER
jgi:hypothetical protein